ncbi:cyclopropane-fatty-acyl-phospholipid synthase family protein [Rhizobium sp. BK176]|uniref:SAM-dependent methyltransferase n=1 Tax=Rhizobium sp. BK176 TaxID=2587071 RepID=UPI00216734F4|nr:class I SAM-dependent methyltransferase [Rhizobium sp. BK176]MCS4090043.1 SAM-dependent methyltransferase [Rhizobium sp. BK176]
MQAGDTETLAAFADVLLRCGDVYAPDEQALRLRMAVDSRKAIEVFDYASHAEAFTRAYGMRNALKCVASIGAAGIDASRYGRVLDIGCGSGSFSLAFAFLADNPRLVLSGFDGSDSQLGIAKRLLGLAKLQGDITFSKRDLPASFPARADLTLSSFWFCENRHAYRDPELFDLVAGDETLIVDYPEVVDDIEALLPVSRFSVRKSRLDVVVPASVVSSVGQERAGAYSILVERR